MGLSFEARSGALFAATSQTISFSHLILEERLAGGPNGLRCQEFRFADDVAQ
jgi:hypothetical protein